MFLKKDSLPLTLTGHDRLKSLTHLKKLNEFKNMKFKNIKLELLETTTSLTKSMFYLFLLQFTFLQPSFAGSSSGQNKTLKEVKIGIDIRNATLTDVFEEIEAKTNFSFVYDRSISGIKQKFTFERKNMSLEEILSFIANKEKLQFQRINESIYTKRVPNSETVKPVIELDRDVSGKVRDAETGGPLIGASVVARVDTASTIIDTNMIGAITDSEGSFTLSIPDDVKFLVISYAGFLTQKIPIDEGKSTFDISLMPDVSALKEVVVVGYGSVEKANVIGSIAGIKSDDLKDIPVTGFDQALAGQIAGVNIAQSSGRPGSAPNITIRGIGTLTAGTQPLLVIDGFPIDDMLFSDINPNDIASVEVLKDAYASAIYGSRGGNGVLLVTTKKGAAKGFQINLNAYQGIQNTTNRYDMANAQQWATYQSENYLNNGVFSSEADIPLVYQQAIAGNATVDTDWQDEVFQNAAISNYHLSILGGTDKTDFYISGEVFNQEGIVINSEFKRYSMRANLESNLFENDNASIFKSLKVGVNFAPSLVKEKRQSESHHNGDGIIITGLFMYPNFAPYDENGDLNISEQIIFGQAPIGEGLDNNGARFENAVAVSNYRENPVERLRLLGNTYLDLGLSENLSFKTTFGYNLSNEIDELFRPSIIGSRQNPAPTTSTGSSTTVRILNWINENTLTLDKEFNNSHGLNIVLGQSFQKATILTSSISGQDFATDDISTLNTAATITSASTEQEEWSLISYFGRANYNYMGKYLIGLSLRTDGSSRFGENNKFGFFPATSIGWRISDEPFWNGIKSFTDDFKIRGSYGRTGNNLISNYGSIALMESSNYSISGSALSSGLSTATSPNANLSWETADQINIGADVGFFNNKILFSVDYYHITTKDLLLDLPVPSQSGYETSLQNIGEVQNKGFEFNISSNAIKLGELSVTGNFNIAFNKNEVTKLGLGQDQIIAGMHIIEIGQPLGNFYGYTNLGVFDTEEEIANTVSLDNNVPGDYIWQDSNGDGVLDANDRTVTGNALPDYTYGFSSLFEYKNFDLRFLFQGSHGADVFNFTKFLITTDGGFGNVLAERVEGRWQSANEPGTGWGRAGVTSNFVDRADFYIEDASFLRLRNITLGYTIPAALAQNLKIKKARIYFSAMNPFTFTEYSGYNPEVNSDNELLTDQGGPFSLGVDWGTYPVSRSFVGGINLTF